MGAPRRDRVLENLLLRHQLAVLARPTPDSNTTATVCTAISIARWGGFWRGR